MVGRISPRMLTNSSVFPPFLFSPSRSPRSPLSRWRVKIKAGEDGGRTAEKRAGCRLACGTAGKVGSQENNCSNLSTAKYWLTRICADLVVVVVVDVVDVPVSAVAVGSFFRFLKWREDGSSDLLAGGRRWDYNKLVFPCNRFLSREDSWNGATALAQDISAAGNAAIAL